MDNPRLYGGSFAPPINDSELDRYEELADGAESEVKGYMLEFIKMLRVFRETPESQEASQRSKVGALVTPLEPQEIDRIFDYVPWPSQIPGYAKVFEGLPSGELRNAAFHLLWFATELANDREPLTNDKLPSS